MGKRKYWICWLCLISLQAFGVDDIYHGLSQFHQFRIYPYIDKAYELENAQQYRAAQAELDKALNLEPQAVGLLQYAVELGIKMQLPESELRQRLNRIPQPYRNKQAFMVAMQVVRHGLSATPEQFRRITAGLLPKQYREVYLTNLYAIEGKAGKQVALSWSESVPPEIYSATIFRYQANVYFEHKNFAAVVDAYGKLRPSQLSTEDKMTLGLSYIELGKEVEYRRLLTDTAFSFDDRLRLKRRYISALIFQGRQAEAKKELLALRKITSLTESESAQLAYIFLDEKEQQRQAELASSCLARVEMQLQDESFDRARAVLAGCNPETETDRWINYAQILGAFSLLEKVRFHGTHEATRKKLLSDHYAGKDQWRQIIRLLSASTSTESRIQLASAYAQLKMYRQSALTWMKLFERTKKISYLNLATYQADNLSDKLFLKLLFNKGIDSVGDQLFAHQELSDRLAALIVEHLILFGPDEVDRLNRRFRHRELSPALWQRRHLCDRLAGVSNRSAFHMKANAFCLAEDDLEKAVSLYGSAVAGQAYAEDTITLAVWNTLLGRYQQALPYWDASDITEQNEQQQYLHILTLLKTGRTAEAEALWQRYHQQGLRWELLAAELADQTGDRPGAYQRYYTIFSAYDSPVATRWLFDYARNDAPQREMFIEQILSGEKTDSAAEAAYLITTIDPLQAERLYQKAAFTEPYTEDAYFHSAYADIATQNGHKRLALWVYRENIDRLTSLTNIQPDLLAYQQRAYRDLSIGWKFSVEGWMGRSRGEVEPGLSGQAGDYFVREEAKYYLDAPPLMDSAFFLAMQHSQVFDSGSNDFSSSELDVGYRFRLLPDMNYYLDLGLLQSLHSESYTHTYIRLKADVFSQDDWSKAWQAEAGSWLYQQLYFDAVSYLDEISDYTLFSRYSLGRTFKLREENRHRLTPYLFAQWGKVDEQQSDQRVGSGISWRWEFNRDLYKGYGTIADLGVEWQHMIDPQPGQNGESYLLRFSFLF